ncbi:lipopolysaccharide export system protein LptC [Nitrosomonas sp. Nm84]|uniref:LPS export ABC transporter periplasmic protein LptC n=1 Tax=Nitrosomonas sp. Nm84 TaxID=200124 RepID=UPI000D76EDEF|nr:LPS export ABC transporter periplasmic protein LptC [Nitrosomonas sp. Nm84]PXW81602.1 lipopolysaccharide export system protein LptC [Nitrosomonas sp. Nm84]
MFSRLHISFPLVLFILLILLTFWLDRITRPSEQTKDDDLYRNPDYIVEDLSGIQVEYGRAIQREFTAQKLFHYLNENVTQMEHISFMNTEPDKPLIRLQADRAQVRNKGENIFLMNNVTAIRGADDEKGKITLMTNFLHLIPDEGLVKTDQAVTILRLQTTINAIGMELDNQSGMIQLLTRVKAVNTK